MRLAPIAVAMLVLHNLAAAQTEMPGLQIVLAPIREDSANECGINGSSIESVAALALRDHGIRAVASGNPLLVINTNVIRHPIGCVTHLLIEIKEAVRVEQVGGFAPKNGTAWTVLCDSGTLMTGPVARITHEFYRAIESQVNVCLRQINY